MNSTTPVGRNKLLSAILVLTLIVPSIALGHEGHVHPRVLHFVNGQWFDGEKFVKQDLYSVDGTFRTTYAGKDAVDVDLTGKFLLPPFMDLHHHIGAAAPDSTVAKQLISQGVFYVKDPASVLAAKTVYATKERGRLEVVATWGGVTSQGGHPMQIFSMLAQRGAWELTSENIDGNAAIQCDTEAELKAKLAKLIEQKPPFVKFYLEESEFHNERKGKPEFVGKRGLDPALLAIGVALVKQAGIGTTVHVHSAADFRAAIKAGVDEITHLPLEAITDADAVAVAKAGITVITTVNSHRAAPPNAMEIHKQNIALLKKHGMRLLAGTDNGGRALLKELHMLGGTGQFSMLELIRMSTVDAAQYLFPGRKIGKLQDGYEASFIAFAENPLQSPPTLGNVVMAVKQGIVETLEPLPPMDAPGHH